MSNATFSPDARRILADAMSLSSAERAALAEELVSSLEPADPRIEAIRIAEARDRLAAFEAGETDAITLDELFEESDET